MGVNQWGYIFNTEGLLSFEKGNSMVTYVVNEDIVDIKDIFLEKSENGFYNEFSDLIIEMFEQLLPTEIKFNTLPQETEHISLESIFLNNRLLLLVLPDGTFAVVRMPPEIEGENEPL